MTYIWSYGHKSADAAWISLQSDISECTVSAFEAARALIKEGESFDFEAFQDLGQAVSEWMNDCDSALTEWAQARARHDFIWFGSFPDSGSVGFAVNVEGAQSDADLQISDLSELPRGFSGLAVLVNDHGNVSAFQCTRGKRRELFSVV